MIWNPCVSLKHSWENTHSVWGKLCIILFYSYLWINIIGALLEVLFPAAGTECLFKDLSEYAKYMSTMYIQQLNLFSLGFLLYATLGGIKVLNVGVVFLFFFVSDVGMFKLVRDYPGLDGIPEGCMNTISALSVMGWVVILWLGLALFFSILEHKRNLGPESSPLLPTE
jgi:hypothetical protein